MTFRTVVIAGCGVLAVWGLHTCAKPKPLHPLQYATGDTTRALEEVHKAATEAQQWLYATLGKLYVTPEGGLDQTPHWWS